MLNIWLKLNNNIGMKNDIILSKWKEVINIYDLDHTCKVEKHMC
jgi:hypothetical protein